MTEPLEDLLPPIYILMKPEQDRDIGFLDVRSSVQDAEGMLARCLRDTQPPQHFLYFDERGQPLDAVATSPTSLVLRPTTAPPDRERLWADVEQALGSVDQYLQDDDEARAIFGEEFEEFKAAVQRHRVDPKYPIPPFSRVYGPYGLCCRIIDSICCRCRTSEEQQQE
jgi:hypothetical protein